MGNVARPSDLVTQRPTFSPRLGAMAAPAVAKPDMSASNAKPGFNVPQNSQQVSAKSGLANVVTAGHLSGRANVSAAGHFHMK